MPDNLSVLVTLEKITISNWRAVAQLQVAPHQRDFVASNAWSLAEAGFNAFAVPRAIYALNEPVGFAMWESGGSSGRPHDYMIFRFMIDQAQQGKGYGRRAMQLVLDEIRRDREAEKIEICYVPGNSVSKKFYASFGFNEIGIDEDGEMRAEIVI